LDRAAFERQLLEDVLERASLVAREGLGFCRIVAGAHGYEWEGDDGQFLWMTSGGVTPSEPRTKKRIEMDLDLDVELSRLRAENPQLRCVLPQGQEASRYALLEIAVGLDVEWVKFPRPLIGWPFPETAIARLYDAIFCWPGFPQPRSWRRAFNT
jgi:hypothetical protein